MAISRSFDGRWLTIRSPMEISPEVICSRPATMRSVVVLPQPDGPTRTMNSLSRIVRFTSLTACTSSYFLLSSLSTTCAMSDLALRLDWSAAAGGLRIAYGQGKSIGEFHRRTRRHMPGALEGIRVIDFGQYIA